MADLTNAVWRKSTRSSSSNQCVEVAANLVSDQGIVGVRDSKDPHGPVFALAPASFTAFVTDLKAGHFDA